MNASRAKRLARASLSAALAIVAVPSIAFAQEPSPQPLDLSAPIRLEPPAGAGEDEPARPRSTYTPPTYAQPVQQQPAPGDGAVDGQGVQMYGDDAAPVIGGKVEAETLGTINPDVAGVLSTAEGGFGAAMWAGTQNGVIEHLLPQVPVTTASPAVRDLMRRLLLTGAEVPEGGVTGALISLRAGLLSAMGDFVGVKSLLNAVPGRATNPDLLRVEVDTRFLTGDVARACQLAHAYIQEQQSSYWQKAFIFCQALEGDSAKARLGLALLEELGVDDPVFFQLVDALARQNDPAYKAPVIDSLSDPTPLHLALARVAKVTLPSDVIASNRPGVLRAIAISPNAAPELRLEAAERAEVAGALPVDALRQLYASISFSEDELKNPLTHAAQRSGPMSRALLYRATLMQTVPSAQAEALHRAMLLARQGGRYASTARAFLPQLSRIPSSTELAWFAPEAIRAFLITGRHAEAGPWFELLKDVASREPKMAAELASLMPVARLSGFEGASAWTMENLHAWWIAVKDSDGARDKAVMLAATLEALGEFVPDEIWTDLIAGTSHTALLAPYPAHWFLLDNASHRGRVGETVLLSLVALGDGGPARADPIVLHHVLRALRTIGLEGEVRAMALEAVVAAGL
ncbi:hypothetical protein [Magnetovibrio sp.]|uniref:hypothetical protein n=1 Tax=Magnetovibrio sp. TaxID=2024836 RepID=UPI002F922067